jgi:O-antigen/teichoic acid export membrane protein
MTAHGDANRTGELSRGTARIASASALRQLLVTGLSAASAAVIARGLGASGFGVYAGGTAAFYLAISLTDLGFAIVLARELATRPEEEGQLVRATVHVQLLWSAGIALGLLVLAVVAGGTRGAVMAVLAPAVVLSGMSAARQVFSVRFRAGPLLVLDIVTALVQAAALIVLAALGVSPVVLAGALAAAISLNVVLAALLARRLVEWAPPRRGDRRRILRLALPVGVASVLSSLYFTIDQVLLGWLVSSRELGHYAAAVRFLTALVAIPGLVMAAGIPGLARTVSDRERLSRFAATLAHWLAVTALPLCVGLAVFARPAVRLVFGAGYGESVGLLRVLMLAGALSLANNVLSIVLISASVVRTMVVVNLISLAVNVAGNLALVPQYGVAASAWLTVASEAVVIVYGLLALRRRLSYGIVAAELWRSLVVCAAAGAVGLALGPSRPYALAGAVATFVIGVAVLGAWPADLRPARRQAAEAPVARA